MQLHTGQRLLFDALAVQQCEEVVVRRGARSPLQDLVDVLTLVRDREIVLVAEQDGRVVVGRTQFSTLCDRQSITLHQVADHNRCRADLVRLSRSRQIRHTGMRTHQHVRRLQTALQEPSFDLRQVNAAQWCAWQTVRRNQRQAVDAHLVDAIDRLQDLAHPFTIMRNWEERNLSISNRLSFILEFESKKIPKTLTSSLPRCSPASARRSRRFADLSAL